MKERPFFTFIVLGRYPARLKGNQSQVTVNVLGGGQGHQAYCGTLTMSEEEWNTFIRGLKDSLGAGVRVEDDGVAEAV
jgi:hypothetical protein